MTEVTPVPEPASDGDAAGGERRGSGARQQRPRYGRRRGPVPIGTSFVPRLGPSAGEPFAAIDDVDEELDTTPRRATGT